MPSVNHLHYYIHKERLRIHEIAKSFLSEDDDNVDVELDTKNLQTASGFDILEELSERFSIEVSNEMRDVFDEYVSKNNDYKEHASKMNLTEKKDLAEYFQLQGDLRDTRLAKAMGSKNAMVNFINELEKERENNKPLLIENLKNKEGSVQNIVQETMFQWIGKSIRNVIRKIGNAGYSLQVVATYTVFFLLAVGLIIKILNANDVIDFRINPNNSTYLDFAQLNDEVNPVQSVMKYASGLFSKSVGALDTALDIMLFQGALVGPADGFWRIDTGAEINNETWVGKIAESYGVDNSSYQDLTSIPWNFKAAETYSNRLVEIETRYVKNTATFNAIRDGSKAARSALMGAALKIGAETGKGFASGGPMGAGAGLAKGLCEVFGSGLMNRVYAALPTVLYEVTTAGAKLKTEKLIADMKESYNKDVNRILWETEQSWLANALVSGLLIRSMKNILKNKKRTWLFTALNWSDKAYMLANIYMLQTTFIGLQFRELSLEIGGKMINKLLGLQALKNMTNLTLWLLMGLHGLSWVKETANDVLGYLLYGSAKFLSMCIETEDLKDKISEAERKQLKVLIGKVSEKELKQLLDKKQLTLTDKQRLPTLKDESEEAKQIKQLKAQLALKNKELKKVQKQLEEQQVKEKEKYIKEQEGQEQIEKKLEAKIPQVGDRVGVKEKNGTILYGVIKKLLKKGKFSVLLDSGKRKYPTIDKIVRQEASSKKSPSAVPNLKF